MPSKSKGLVVSECLTSGFVFVEAGGGGGRAWLKATGTTQATSVTCVQRRASAPPAARSHIKSSYSKMLQPRSTVYGRRPLTCETANPMKPTFVGVSPRELSSRFNVTVFAFKRVRLTVARRNTTSREQSRDCAASRSHCSASLGASYRSSLSSSLTQAAPTRV